MSGLQEHETLLLSQRFDNFCDSVVKLISITYPDGVKTGTLAIESQDFGSTVDNEWVTVVFTIVDLAEAVVKEFPNTSLVVASPGVNICWFDGMPSIEFSGEFWSPPESLQELRKSYAFMRGRTLAIDVKPYGVI
ncbi:MAG: hypothetical protein ACRDD1_13130 [Planctomycetia bacterium]